MSEEFAGRYVPRPQFIEYHNRTEVLAKIIAHRRAGKTVSCVNDLIARAMLNNRQGHNPPRYGYVGPSFVQVKDVAWGYLKHYTGPLAVATNESELWVDLPNRARIRLYGADNVDRMRGLYFDGVVIDEPADLRPSAWPLVIQPTLADHNGWATFIGTPRGHDWFYHVDHKPDSSELEEGWFRLTLKASETGILGPEQLESQKRGKTPEQYAQEFECSFDAAIHGAYFAAGIAETKRQGRVTRVAADPVLQLRCFFDIGGGGDASDATAIWICQFVKREIRILDYIEATGQPIGYYAHIFREKGYDKAELVFPHDGLRKDNLAKSYEDHWRDAGWTRTRSIPNQGRGADLARIAAVRRILPSCWFHEETTKNGVEALVHYHEKWDEERRMGMGPLHDWSSHCFTGDTRVLTRYGTHPIYTLPKSGEVMTRCGWKRYYNPRITRKNAPLVEVGFADGLTVKCTPDHLFLTASGWKSAESLMPDTVIQSCWMPSLNGLTAAPTSAGRAARIIVGGARSFTGKLGRWLSEKFQQGVTSIIGMLTRPIIPWPIWNACPQANISVRPGIEPRGLGTILARLLGGGRLSGTLRRPVGSGTDSMQDGLRAGRSGSASQPIAWSAANNSRRSFELTADNKFTAGKLANRLRITAVRKLDERADVWCLTVPDEECFALVNGAIVHNCADAFGLMAICYEKPEAQPKPLVFPNYGVA